jgi:alpha-beta hydrolase superfamily lysophospholipase
LTPGREYLNDRDYTLVVFDLRALGSAERLHRERAAWRENADIELLDFDHAVLIVRPGAARRLAS